MRQDAPSQLRSHCASGRTASGCRLALFSPRSTARPGSRHRSGCRTRHHRHPPSDIQRTLRAKSRRLAEMSNCRSRSKMNSSPASPSARLSWSRSAGSNFRTIRSKAFLAFVLIGGAIGGAPTKRAGGSAKPAEGWMCKRNGIWMTVEILANGLDNCPSEVPGRQASTNARKTQLQQNGGDILMFELDGTAASLIWFINTRRCSVFPDRFDPPAPP